MANKIRFLISRLRKASLAELAYRVREEALVFRCKKLIRYSSDPFVVPAISRDDVEKLSMPTTASRIQLHELERFMAGALCCLNTDAEEINEFEFGVQEKYFSSIGQVQGGPDIRAVWEPARLQHAAALLLHHYHNPASEIGGRCADYAKDCIIKWIKKNPFLRGPHYASAMECGLRVPVFFLALKNLSLDYRETSRILSAIYHHGWWIGKRLSLYSSLGNHTVCECLGLVFAGAVFRKTAVGGQWLNRGIELLKQELHHQVLPDGGPVEQSLHYHRFVLDAYWLAVDFLEKNSLADLGELKPRLLQGEKFAAAFMDDNGKIPAIGDSDDGYVIALGIAPHRGAATVEKRKFQFFPDAGYSVIRLGNGALATFDHGPLGMAPLYNHGHADALSITVTQNGEQMLVDPGTYRYNDVPEWRQYFKGTRAHNTVTIDGLDQAVQETGFIWSKPFTTDLVRSEVTDQWILLQAVHNGYVRLKQPVKHKRTILVADEGYLLVKDTFSGKGTHVYELNFHLHPDATVEEDDGWWRVRKGECSLVMRLLRDINFTYVCGQESPPLGWYSPAYGIKQKCGVLQARDNGRPGEVAFVTAISFEKQASIEKLQQLACAL